MCNSPKLDYRRVGESDVGAEGDHADSGRDALTATETRTALELVLERSGKGNHQKIGGGIQEHRKSAEKDELEENMPRSAAMN